MSQVTLLSQVVSLLPRHLFDRVVKKHQSDKHTKGITSWDHFISLLYCHIAKADSLRDISNGLRSTLGNRSHLGLKHVPSKSSLSYINKHRSWEVFRDFYFLLYDHFKLEGLPERDRLKNITRKLYLIDASVVPLCLSVFDWAAYRTRKGGIKLHAMLDYDGLLPVFCHMTDAKTHELMVAKEQVYPKGSVLVFDRAYIDFAWWKKLDSCGCFFVTRAKKNLDYRILAERSIKPKEKDCVIADYLIQIQSPIAMKADLGKLRLIRYYDPANDKEYEFLTNQMIWTASDVALAYKQRWEIEVFFKYIKQNVQIKSFIGTSPNAVLSQIWVGLISFLLAKHLKFKAQFKWSMANLINFLRLGTFSKVKLFDWLNYPFEVETPPPKGQLRLDL